MVQDDDALQLLLVEDNPGDARYITELLKEATELSARVQGSGGGEQALETNDATPPTIHHETRLAAGLELLDDVAADVVLLDLDLPDSKGLETLTTTLERTAIPVVVLTGLSDREIGMQALRQGADEYLVKDEINSDVLIRTLYHAIERRSNERELRRYEVLIEESTDVNMVLGLDGTLQYTTPSVESVLGYAPEELTGERLFEHIHPDDRERVEEQFDKVSEGENLSSSEFRIESKDGTWVFLEARSRNLRDDPVIGGVVLYTRDVTERKRRENELAQQRERLSTLNQLNSVVQEITHQVIDSATREELEEAVCRSIADSDAYSFAWIGEIDGAADEVVVRTEAGVNDYLDGIDITVDESPTGQGPTGRALRTGSLQVTRDVSEDPKYGPWRDHAEERGYRSSAAIPIQHDGSLYGVLNVYTDRPYAFDEDEQAVIGRLGEVIGHAITTLERKQALVSDEVVEVEFMIRNYLDLLDVDDVASDPITFDRVVPIGDGRWAVYGVASGDSIDVLYAIEEHDPSWSEVTVLAEHDDGVHFELDVESSSFLTAVVEHDGRIDHATIKDRSLTVVVHLPPSASVRSVVDSIREIYSETQMIAQRRTKRPQNAQANVQRTFHEGLTLRQQSALEAAYYSGFFEWPRDSSGEDVAEMLDVSAPTFHQHLRAAERRLLEAMFEQSDE